ncbi:MAG: glycosyltransferase family 2 protein [Patescibacteria group bacterium]
MTDDNNKLNILLSIVIPVYGGEKTIPLVCDEIINKLKDLKYEIILVNDDSPDNSHEVCLRLHNKYQQIIKYVKLSINSGEHNAVMAGLSFTSGDYVVVLDDDNQNSVEDIVRLLQFARQNRYDCVYTYYSKKQHSLYRNFGSWFNNLCATILLKKPYNLYLCSFKLFSKFVVKEVVKYKGPFPYIDGLILQVTSNIGKLQVSHQKREIDKSHYTLKKLISLWLNTFTNFSIIPLRISTVMGLFFSLVGLFYGAYTIYQKIFNNIEIYKGWTSTMVVILTFAGVQLIILGVIGEYIGRLFLSHNKKPQYTIYKKYF